MSINHLTSNTGLFSSLHKFLLTCLVSRNEGKKRQYPLLINSHLKSMETIWNFMKQFTEVSIFFIVVIYLSNLFRSKV